MHERERLQPGSEARPHEPKAYRPLDGFLEPASAVGGRRVHGARLAETHTRKAVSAIRLQPGSQEPGRRPVAARVHPASAGASRLAARQQAS